MLQLGFVETGRARPSREMLLCQADRIDKLLRDRNQRPLACGYVLAVYIASRAALSAFAAVLAREVERFGIRVREVLPGRVPSTPFSTKGCARVHLPDVYRPVAEAPMAEWQTPGPVSTADDLAGEVWRTVTEEAAPERLPARVDPEALVT